MKTKTDAIRELLDERGIQYFKRDMGGKRFTAWGRKDVNRATFLESGIGTPLHRTYFTAENITPKQAIAATLGIESIDYMLNTIGRLEEENERLRSSCGTLTAEQVREAIEKRFDFDVWVPKERWQAIADELNDMLGSDDEYEAKMDALLCRLTNGKWSKSRAYDLDFMVSCVDEEYEDAYEKERAELGSEINGDTSDGYHTFNELYHHRAVLFSVIVRDHRELAWKARKHHDGTMYDGMFIVGVETPKGQATYHYDIDPYWEMFDCEEREFAPEWDGHTPDDAIARIAELGSGTCEMHRYRNALGVIDEWQCSECGADVNGIADDTPPNFCPNCGKAVER